MNEDEHKAKPFDKIAAIVNKHFKDKRVTVECYEDGERERYKVHLSHGGLFAACGKNMTYDEACKLQIEITAVLQFAGMVVYRRG